MKPTPHSIPWSQIIQDAGGIITSLAKHKAVKKSTKVVKKQAKAHGVAWSSIILALIGLASTAIQSCNSDNFRKFQYGPRYKADMLQRQKDEAWNAARNNAIRQSLNEANTNNRHEDKK